MEYPEEKKKMYILCIKDANWILNKGGGYGKWRYLGSLGGKG